MLEDIRRARRSVDIEMYCFADDFVGCRFARALAERAEQGVDVRVLVDAAGCRRTPRSFFGWMRERGIRVRGVNPLRKFFLHGALFRWRDHRKLVVVDGASAFVGGLNLSRDYAGVNEGGCGWRTRHRSPDRRLRARDSFDRHWKDETAVGPGRWAPARSAAGADGRHSRARARIPPHQGGPLRRCSAAPWSARERV
jgi:phosphatidylserine/phosphatidylglycerophosphate/cardiolipin synthase-like enzyme